MRVGVLALQGDFKDHLAALDRLGVDSFPVRGGSELSRCDGLIIPGGESTAISRLLRKWGLFDPLRGKVENGFPVFGTCAGVILLAEEVLGEEVPTLGGLDVKLRRNGYGRQIDSFEADLSLDGPLQGEVRGVFIRAPLILEVGEGVRVLATHGGSSVLVRENNLLGATFHPELTEGTELHRYFVEQIIAG